MTDTIIIISACKLFRAVKTNEFEYKLIRRKDEEVIGWLREFDTKNGDRWLFDPLFVPLSASQLMDLSNLIVTIKERHLKERLGDDYIEDDQA